MTAPEDLDERWRHLPVKHLVLATEEFIVFLDHELDVDWETSPEWDRRGAKDSRKHHAILNDAALLESTPCHGLTTETKAQFRRLLGEAIARSLDDDYPNASAMLVEAKQYVVARQRETSRYWYLSASEVAAAAASGLGLVFWLCRASAVAILGQEAVFLALAAVAGCVGAWLSIVLRLGKLDVDCAAGRRVHYLEAVSRIGAGGICGAIAALAVRAEILLAPLSRGQRPLLVLLLAGVAAGASERWVPSIISRLSSASLSLHESRSAVDHAENANEEDSAAHRESR